MEPADNNNTLPNNNLEKNMAELLRELKNQAELISKLFGSELNNPDELENRVKQLDILRTEIAVIESIVGMLNDIERRESNRIEKFIHDTVARYDNLRGLLNKKHVNNNEEHVPIKPLIETDDPVRSAPAISPVRTTSPVPSDGSDSSDGTSGTPGTTTTGSWAMVAKRGRAVPTVAPTTGIPSGTTKNPPTPTVGGRKVSSKDAAPGAPLSCVIVGKTAECHLHLGHICYAEKEETFCISVNGVMIDLGPGIPIIFDNNQTHRKNLIHQPLKPGQKLNPNDTDFFVPLNHSTEKADQAYLSNRTGYVPKNQGNDPRRFNYCTRIGDAKNFVEDVGGLHEDHPDYIYFKNLATCNFLTLVTIHNHFKERMTRK